MRPQRKNVPKPSWLKDKIAFALSITKAEIPNHYKEAIDSPDGDKWKKMMGEKSEVATRQEDNRMQMGICKEGRISRRSWYSLHGTVGS